MFSKHLTLPIETFPKNRARPASIRHLFPRQGNSLPIKYTNSTASRNRIDTLRLEDEQSTINL